MQTPKSSVVAQAVFTAWELKKGVELDFESIEPGKGLDRFVGQSLVYDSISVPLNTLTPGDSVRPIKFNRTNERTFLKDGVKYAALIAENVVDSDKPYITCVGLHSDLDEAKAVKTKIREALKAEKEVANDLSAYSIEVQGWKFRGTNREIMDHFTQEWAEDPTETLLDQDARWKKKGVDNKYVDVPIPTILPPVNQFLLRNASKAKEERKKQSA